MYPMWSDFPEESVIKMSKTKGIENPEDPARDMSGHGWSKSLTRKYILENDKGLFCQEWDFYVEDIQHECGTSDYLWLSSDRTMFLICMWCRSVETLSRERGILKKEYRITPNEALEILVSHKFRITDMPCRRFAKMLRKRSPKLLKRRPRPKKRD